MYPLRPLGFLREGKTPAQECTSLYILEHRVFLLAQKTRRTFLHTGVLPVLSPQNKPFIHSDTRSETLEVTDVLSTAQNSC